MSNRLPDTRPHPWAIVLLVCLGAAFSAAFWILGAGLRDAPGFPLDDAWIHQVYARSIATEGLLAYNPGVPSAGCTAPLWSILLGLVHRIAPESIRIHAVLLLGTGFHLLTLILIADLTRRISGRTSAGLLAGALCALSPPLVAGALSGMEVSLCAALLTAAVWAAVCQRAWFGGVALALAAAARPESALVSVVVFLLCSRQKWITDRPRWAASVPAWVLPSLIVLVAWTASNIHVTGRPLPATYYLKESVHLFALPERMWTVLTQMINRVPPFAGWVGWLSLIGFIVRPPPWQAWLPGLAGGAFLISSAMVAAPVDPGAFYHLRYILPGVPLLIAGLVIGADRCAYALPDRVRNAPMILLAMVGAAGGLLLLPGQAQHHANDIRNVNEVQVAMGHWLAEHTPEGAWIAASDAGAVRYFSNRPTVDVMGLNTPELYAQGHDWMKAHPVVAFAAMPAWIEMSTADSPLEEATRFSTDPYTISTIPNVVTPVSSMATQIIWRLPPDQPTHMQQFKGARTFALQFKPWPATRQ